MDLKAKVCCKPCFDKFKTDANMNVTKAKAVNGKTHCYTCPTCNRVALIRDAFWNEMEFQNEKIYIYPR